MSHIKHLASTLFSLLLLCFALNTYAANTPVQTGNSIAPMLQAIMPTIVNISAKGDKTSDSANLYPNGNGGFSSLGSGVIIDAKKGYIVTNAHVINGATTITVTLKDGRALTAKQIGVDTPSDIALIQIKADDLTAASFGDSSSIQVGDFVAAIGSPYGLNQTVTSGIISAKQRHGLGLEGYEDFLQTDAPINPGNSGGALVDLQGKVIGINTAILGPDGGNIGIGFAIPSNMVQAVVKQLIKYGKVDRGMMGILVQSLTPALNQAIGLKQSTEGAIVSQVLPNSPAAKAGFKVGDVVTEINGKPVKSASDVRNTVGFIRQKSSVKFTISRAGKQQTLTATTQSRDAYKEERKKENPFLSGVSFSNINAQSPSHGQVMGVKVLQVASDSKAWAGGLRPNDVIVSANQKPVNNIEALNAAVTDKSKTLLLNVLRSNGAIFLVIK